MSQRLFNSCNALSMGISQNKSTLLLLNSLYLLLLICLSFNTNAQQNSQIDFHNISVDFTQTLGDGISGNGSFKIAPINKQLIQTEYNFNRATTNNPYSISYTYNTHINEDGSFAMDLKSVVEPLELRIDQNIDIQFYGDQISFPSKLKVGNTLSDAEGYSILKKKSGNMILMYNIKVVNRKVERKESIDVDGKQLTAFVISYDYTLEKSNPYDIVIQKSKHKVTDWIIPSLGIVKQDRMGSSTIGLDSNEESSINQFSHKSNLDSFNIN